MVFKFLQGLSVDLIYGVFKFGSIINDLIWRLGRAAVVTQSRFEKCDRLFFEKSAVYADHEWRPCHVETGGQNSPLLTRFQAGKLPKKAM